MKKTISTFNILIFTILTFAFAAPAQDGGISTSGRGLYNQLRAFSLNGGKADVTNLTLTRDRVTMTFNGTFYFTGAVEGKITGAVFVGQGTTKAEVPPSRFEKENLKRLLNADSFESDFKTAVLRFTDDTFDIIGKTRADAPVDANAQKLAIESDARTLKETGANIPSRLALSILNRENPGFFMATFDGGQRDRFSFVMDHQNRIPTSYFDINGGEKGLIFAFRQSIFDNETWLAFYSLADYQAQAVSYSDANDLVDITDYKMEIDMRAPKSRLGLRTKVAMTARTGNVSAIPFTIGESLGTFDDVRLKKQMRLKAVRINGESVDFSQEDWEAAMTVFLPKPLAAGVSAEIEFEMEGDFIRQPLIYGDEAHYPRSNTSWYPRHGYLDRATYEMRFTHSKNFKIATVGVRESEAISPEDKDLMITKYTMKHPVSFVTFAMARFLRKTEMIKWDGGETPTPLEYSSVTFIPIKEEFIMAELNNSVRYFQSLFGKYPYDSYGAAFHPFGFGQGFPSMILIPDTDRASKYTYSFLAHETAHQWWGNIVAWRSYRDQWLSEGFAEYSGILYTALRKDYKASIHLIEELRDSLKQPPETRTGVGKGKLADVGPIILGHRLNTSKTYGAYNTLIYNKGALVLRMLHFLFTDPQSGNGEPFFAMMKDFVEKHRNGVASTDDFIQVANKHFVNTPIAKKYQLTDLNWFFRQYVYETDLPSYNLQYTLQDQPDGTCVLSGVVTQENASPNFAMVLPLAFQMSESSAARTTIAAVGPTTNFSLKLPRRPQKVELDPQNWVLSEKTKTASK